MRDDRRETLFYPDPLDWGGEGDDGKALFARMADVFGAIQGRFMLLLNALPEVRDTVVRFLIAGDETTHTISTAPGSKNPRKSC